MVDAGRASSGSRAAAERTRARTRSTVAVPSAAGGAATGEEQWVTAWLTPNGDDPRPALEILLWAAPAALVEHLAELDALLPGS